MRKADERRNPESTWNKAGEDEPLFILRGQDAIAPGVVRAWAHLAASAGLPVEKFHEAIAFADEMEGFTPRKNPD